MWRGFQFQDAKCFDDLSEVSGLGLIFNDETEEAGVSSIEMVELDSTLEMVR